jgi:hypothetical protein
VLVKRSLAAFGVAAFFRLDPGAAGVGLALIAGLLLIVGALLVLDRSVSLTRRKTPQYTSYVLRFPKASCGRSRRRP